MASFVSFLFVVQLGLSSSQIGQAGLSLRQEALAVAVTNAERAAFVGQLEAGEPYLAITETTWRAPPRQRHTREDWQRLLERSLTNDRLTSTVAWVLTQPVRVRVSERRFFVTLRMSAP